jgi:hypothetical protein
MSIQMKHSILTRKKGFRKLIHDNFNTVICVLAKSFAGLPKPLMKFKSIDIFLYNLIYFNFESQIISEN